MSKKYQVMLEALFLICIYILGLYFRLLPRLDIDPHLLTFEADIWYRLTMAQYLFDHGTLPIFDIRYEAYGQVPFWYPPISLYVFSYLSALTHLDIPTVSSRVMPFIESLTPLSIYFLCRYLSGIRAACITTLFLALTPSFVFWSGISDPQSFILFMIPLVLWIWIKHAEALINTHKKSVWRFLRILFLGFILAVCFLTHLFFFLMVGILFLITLGLWIKKHTKSKIWLDFFLILFLSQIMTIWWWGPSNLYWWWLFSIVTSSGLYPITKQLENYGSIAALVGIYFWCLLSIKSFKKSSIKYAWVPVLWALIPLFESQNENILTLIGKLDWSWSTLAKPVEGFRFYCFLAQPLAMAFGLMSDYLIRSFKDHQKHWSWLAWVPLIFILLIVNIHWDYNFNVRITNAGFSMDEIKGARWFRENSKENDRIIADYYRSQMFAGFAGGKALLGIAFPLKHVDLAHISKDDYTVPDDIYKIYTTDDPEEAISLMKRYGATHLLVSANMAKTGNFISAEQKGFGIDYNYTILQNSKYFRPVYQDESKVVILERIK